MSPDVTEMTHDSADHPPAEGKMIVWGRRFRLRRVGTGATWCCRAKRSVYGL